MKEGTKKALIVTNSLGGMMMSSLRRRWAVVGSTGALALGVLVIAPIAGATGSPPTVVEGNPTCTSLGYDHGTKFDYPAFAPGSYPIGNGQVTWSYDGASVGFTSTIGLDAVIVKGGPQANVYTYDPPSESFGDTGLLTPNNASGGPAGLSHVEFCYDYELSISAQADVSYTRTYSWSIAKTSDAAGLTLQPGQTQDVGYTVSVDQTHQDSGFALAGTVTVHNPDPSASATIQAVNSSLSGSGALSLDCGVGFPYVLGAGGSLVCAFHVDLADASTQLHSFEVVTSGGPDGAAGSSDVVFAEPTTVVDACVNVADDKVGDLGQVCADQTPKVFTYTLTVGPYAATDCGTHVFGNTATYVASDSGASGSASASVVVQVPCPTGCTLTQGYWKTHSLFGPAPYDDAWGELPSGAETVFFLSGQSYYQVLWTAPKGGSVYYQLAHQYIAASLNSLNGADTSSVNATLAQATAFFATYTPTSALPKQVKAEAGTWAMILDNYNNGLSGTGHCSSEVSGPQ